LNSKEWQDDVIKYLNRKITNFAISDLAMICSSKLESEAWQILVQQFYQINHKSQMKNFSIIVAVDEKN